MQTHRKREKTGRPAAKRRKKAGEKHAFLNALVLFVAMGVGLFFINVIIENFGFAEQPVMIGATFSKPYAEYFGLDWKATYTALLDDMGARWLRIPAYWNDIEPERDVYDFDDVDWQLIEAEKRDAKVILAVGRKLPRWPECHVPTWARGLNEDQAQARVLSMVEKVVRRYKDDPAIVAWQVENEPFFKFGDCPEPDRTFLQREVAIVRSLDRRPIVITESGELSTWINAASIADVLGISTYRIVWGKLIGYFYWPATPRYYIQRISAIRGLVSKVIISELQAEPWVTAPIATIPVGDQLRLMNPTRLGDNISFSKKIGVSEVYLWGVEWWYWLKIKGHPEMWDAGKALFESSRQ